MRAALPARIGIPALFKIQGYERAQCRSHVRMICAVRLLSNPKRPLVQRSRFGAAACRLKNGRIAVKTVTQSPIAGANTRSDIANALLATSSAVGQLSGDPVRFRPVHKATDKFRAFRSVSLLDRGLALPKHFDGFRKSTGPCDKESPNY